MPYTASLRVNLMATGTRNNTWGLGLNNEVIQLLETAIAGVSTIAVTGDVTLTSVSGAADQSRAMQLILTGTLAANFTVTCPNVPKLYIVHNTTNRTATFTIGSGLTVVVETTDRVWIWTDGVDFKSLGFGTYNLKDYIAAQTAAAGAVPGTVGQLGKFLKVTVDGGASTWQQIQSADIGDFDAEVRRRTLVYSLIFGGA